jgi:class 3 adenylate cyclase
MEPRIQYAKTSDGVGIAYWTMGEGRRLLLSPPLLFSHLRLELQYPPLRAWYEQLARYRTVLRWDPRCLGLSDRGSPGPIVGNILDVEAVLQRVPGEPCDIVAISQPGNGAIEYAAAHPEDVANVVIDQPTLRGELFPQGQLEVIHSLAERDETLWSENVARWLLGWERGRLAHAYAEFIRSAINREDAQRIWGENVELDRMSILPRLTARVLVISNPMADRDRQHAREVAAAISDAELVEIADTEVRGAFMNAGEASAINEFLGLMPEPLDEMTPPSGTAIILFADIADSTELTERMGDAAFREKARDLDTALREAITSNGGTAVEGKLLGDGVLATFASAREAIAAGRQCADQGGRIGLPLHVGIHAGDVLREEGNVFGGAVNIAARIADASAPGQVLVSGTVRDLARTSAGVVFEDRGGRELKGVAEPVRVFAVKGE